MNMLILVLYLLSTYYVGRVVIQKVLPGLPWMLSSVGAFLLGTAVSIPLTYGLSCLLVRTGEPLWWGVVASISIVILHIGYRFLTRNKNKTLRIQLNQTITPSEIMLIIFSLIFSTWMMTKTFHSNAAGELFVGSNNVFDFGYSVGLMRSMSWGANIPFSSPFFAGLPLLYHFFFNYWTAIWEYFGVPTVWAINIPSIMSFSALLIVIYCLPQVIARKKPWVGWVAVLFTITNSSLAAWELLVKNGISLGAMEHIWRLPTYPFAGPFDGSTISIFMTLNNYVNQRHLAFAIACGLFIFVGIQQTIKRKITGKSILFWGLVTGCLLLWNIAIYLIVVALCGLCFILQKQWKFLCIFILGAGLVGMILLFPLAGFLYKVLVLFKSLVVLTATATIPTWTLPEYLWQNLGLLPIVAFVGLVAIPQKIRLHFLPFIILFIVLCLLAGIAKRGFDQKFLSFLLIGINILAAFGLEWIWQRKKYAIKASVVVLFIILIASGLVDLMPIKNEFAFPLVSQDTLKIITWIGTNTSKNAVFVSYEDMIDPVVLGGRKNFMGFFRNVGWYDRSKIVSAIYAGDITQAQTENINYILVPKGQKSDFPYLVNLERLKQTSHLVYEDKRYTVFAVE